LMRPSSMACTSSATWAMAVAFSCLGCRLHQTASAGAGHPVLQADPEAVAAQEGKEPV